jgi:undecaprenyl-diphosphatase
MNSSIFIFLHSFAFQSNWFDSLVIFFAEPFIYIFIVVVTAILLLQSHIFDDFNLKSIYRKSRMVIVIAVTTVSGYILANLLKLLIQSDRPFVAMSNVHTLIPESGYAFPSGHSATIAAFAFAVFFKNKRLGYICFLAMLLIGVSRVVSGVHFPIDILGGYALGFLVAYLLKTR